MALHLHIHARGLRFRVKDSKDPHEDLVDRLLEILRKQGALTQDDAQVGHPFYGNQYTDVVTGPKPTEVKSKGIKNQVHELLSSGHGFEIEELQKITGAKLKQQLFNALADLKKQKGLKIEKGNDGKYHVLKENGDPAGKGAPLAEVTQTPTPEPIVAPSPVPEAPSAPPEPDPFENFKLDQQVPVQPTGKAPAEPMTKAQADGAYSQHLNDLNEKIVEKFGEYYGSEDFDPTTNEKNVLTGLAQEWKDGKAKAMAQWAANTKGADHKPKEQEVFPEDIALIKALGDAYDTKAEHKAKVWEKALSDWKSATAKAKQTPPPTAKPPEPKPVDPDPVPTGGHVLEAPKSLVPDDWKGVSLDDFSKEPGSTSSSKFAKNMQSLHEKLYSSNQNAVQNKKTIQQKLTERLASSPHFQNMAKQFKAKGGAYGGSLEAQLISAWASSSGNHHAISVANQLATRDAFNMNPEHVETKAFHYLNSASEEKTFKDSAQQLGIDVGSKEKLESFKAGLRDFALAQYHETQHHLATLGVKEVYVARGMKTPPPSTGAKQVKLKLQPASSFSTSQSTAHQFSAGNSMFYVKVPASQVLSSFCTGFGCTGEHEVVVLAHPGLEAMHIQATSGIAQAAEKINQAHGKAPAPKATPAASPPPPTPAPSSLGISKASQFATKPTPGFAFKETVYPGTIGSVNASNKATMIELAKAGDLNGLQKFKSQLGANLKASKKYATHIEKQLMAQLAQHNAATSAKQTKTVQVAPGTTGVKKNAHYYKKIKEKLLSHPMHSEAVYMGLKNIGHSNEKILGHYDQAYEKQYGVKHEQA